MMDEGEADLLESTGDGDLAFSLFDGEEGFLKTSLRIFSNTLFLGDFFLMISSSSLLSESLWRFLSKNIF